MIIDPSVSAIVTGGASGLGEATVRALRAAGAQVAIFDLNPERGEALAAEIGALFCQVDVMSGQRSGAGPGQLRRRRRGEEDDLPQPGNR